MVEHGHYNARGIYKVSDRRFPPNWKIPLMYVCRLCRRHGWKNQRGPDITPAATGYRADFISVGSEASYVKVVLNEVPGY